MPGLQLGAGAQVRSGSQVNYGSVANPATSMVAGFGPAAAPAGGSGLGALTPTHPAGLAFWVAIAASIGLLVLYKSAPA